VRLSDVFWCLHYTHYMPEAHNASKKYKLSRKQGKVDSWTPCCRFGIPVWLVL
jgi:hypothetical protein